MSDQQPYQEEQWDDLPLPDSEAAWQKMQLLLDEEDRRRRAIPFWWWRYAAVGLLVLGSAVGGYFLLRPTGTSTQRSETVSQDRKEKTPEEKYLQKPEEKRFPRQNNSSQKTTVIETTTEQKQIAETEGGKNASDLLQVNPIRKEKRLHPFTSSPEKKIRQKEKAVIRDMLKDWPARISDNNEKTTEPDTLKKLTVKQQKDSVDRKDTASTQTEPLVVSAAQKEKRPKQKAVFVWSAGVGMQQAIAFNGQQTSSHNYRGRQGSLSDHIPSVYLRLQKGKWFAQAGFQYAVPQPVKNFSFSQATVFDAARFNVNVERYFIEKLYYHQLPVSINFHVQPNWSAGIGGVYNILAGAVTEQEISSKNIQTGGEIIHRNLAPVKGFKDSFLYKTTTGILVQTDYHWKRFSLGLRYTQNLQPFIKYTKADGTVADEKNNVLQAIVQFRLWRLE